MPYGDDQHCTDLSALVLLSLLFSNRQPRAGTRRRGGIRRTAATAPLDDSVILQHGYSSSASAPRRSIGL